jgi:hypothetical protein
MKDQIKSVPDVSISHYQRLGVAPGVDPEALRQAFRRKSKALHPDTTALPEAQASLAFQQLKESYALWRTLGVAMPMTPCCAKPLRGLTSSRSPPLILGTGLVNGVRCQEVNGFPWFY